MVNLDNYRAAVDSHEVKFGPADRPKPIIRAVRREADGTVLVETLNMRLQFSAGRHTYCEADLERPRNTDKQNFKDQCQTEDR